MNFDDNPPECAVLLGEAALHFCDPELRERWREAPKGSRSRRVYQAVNLWDGPNANRGSRNTKPDEFGMYKHNYARKAKTNLIKSLRAGSLIAWGRNSDAPKEWAMFPSDFWDTSNVDFRNNIISLTKNGPTYSSVKIALAVGDTDESAGQQSNDKNIPPINDGAPLRSTFRPDNKVQNITTYQARIKGWGERKRPPTRDEDEKWIMKEFNMDRGAARKFREANIKLPWGKKGRPKKDAYD